MARAQRNDNVNKIPEPVMSLKKLQGPEGGGRDFERGASVSEPGKSGAALNGIAGGNFKFWILN